MLTTGGKRFRYCFAHSAKTQEAYLVCTDFLEKLSQILSEPLDVLFTFEGKTKIAVFFVLVCTLAISWGHQSYVSSPIIR